MYLSNKNREAQILSTILLKHDSCNTKRFCDSRVLKNEIAQCLFAWHMIETVVNVNAVVNQLKTGSSESISRLQITYIFVVANN